MVCEEYNIWFKLECYYNAETELFDRSLTDMRSKHDPTEAYLVDTNSISLSNQYARNLRNYIINFAEKNLGVNRNTVSLMLKKELKRYNYSAQGWIDVYNYLIKSGEMEFLNNVR